MAKKKACTAKISVLPKEKQPFKIPNNWFWTDIASINRYSGTAVDPMKFPETIYELYSVPSSANDFPEIISGSEIGSSKQSVIKNDVLLCKINPRINRVWKVSQHTENELLASSEWIVIRNQILNSDYMMFCFRTQFFREYMLSNVSGVGGSLMRAQPKFVKNYPIPIAPVAEQQRIVDRIESIFAKLDEAKEKAQAVVDGFELRKSAILHKAFTGELTAKWREEHSLTLDDWETDNLGDRFEIMSGVQKTPARTPKDHPIPYLAVANVYRDSVDVSEIRYFEVADDELERLKLKNKDLLIVEGNGSGNEIGRCAMWRGELPVCIHQNHIIRMRKKDEKILEEYVLYYLNSDAGKKIMKIRAKTTAGLYNLSVGKIRTIPVPFAMLEEQIEIVRILDSLLAKENAAKEAAESVLEQIDTMKKAVLARAFRGELGTNDPTEASAVELLKSML